MRRTAVFVSLLVVAVVGGCNSSDDNRSASAAASPESSTPRPEPTQESPAVAVKAPACPETSELEEASGMTWEAAPESTSSEIGGALVCGFSTTESGNHYSASIEVYVGQDADQSAEVVAWAKADDSGFLRFTCSNPKNASGVEYCSSPGETGQNFFGLVEAKGRAAGVSGASLVEQDDSGVPYPEAVSADEDFADSLDAVLGTLVQ